MPCGSGWGGASADVSTPRARGNGTEDRSMKRAVAFDVVIAGAGPAGIASACAIGEGARPRRVGMIDDNPTAGGQIWRGRSRDTGAAATWIERFNRCGCELMAGTTI